MNLEFVNKISAGSVSLQHTPSPSTRASEALNAKRLSHLHAEHFVDVQCILLDLDLLLQGELAAAQPFQRYLSQCQCVL